MAVDVGSAVGYLDLDISGFLKNLKTAQDEANAGMDSVEKKFGSSMTSVGDKITSAGSSLTKTVTLPLAGVAAAGIKVATDFEKSMSGVRAITGATGTDFDKLRDQAIDLGAKTAFSSNEVAGAMTEMAKAGWDTQQILDGMAGVLDAAAASGESLGSVSTIVADAITGFGLSAADSARVADLLTQAANAGTIGITDLGESYKYAAPVANALGYSIEDVTVAISAMSTAGIKGGQAGTSLRAALTNMIKPTDTMEGVMRQLGIEIINEDGSMKSLKETMDILRGAFAISTPEIQQQRLQMYEAQMRAEGYGSELDGLTEEQKKLNIAWYVGTGRIQEMSQKEYKKLAMDTYGINLTKQKLTTEQARNLVMQEGMKSLDGLTESEQAASAAALFGKEAMSGMLSILNLSSEEYEKISEQMYNAAGVADETASVMQDNLQNKVEQLGGSLESLAIKLSDFVIPALTNLTIKLTDAVDKFTNLDPETQKSILKFAAFAAAIGPVLFVTGKLITSVGTVVSTIGKIPAAVTAANTGFKAMSTGLVNVKEAFLLSKAGMTGFATQTSVVGAALGTITAPIMLVVAAVGLLVAAFVSLWKNNEEFRTSMIEIWEGIKKTFEDFAKSATEKINQLGFDFKSFGEMISAVWNTFTAILAPVFQIAFATIAAVLNAALNTILGILDVFIGLFTGNWEQMGNGIQTILNAGFEMIKSIFESAYKYINEATGGALDAVVNWFVTLPDRIKEWIDNALKNVVQWADDMGNKAKEMGKNFIDSVVTFFNELPYKVGYYIGLALGTVVKWVIDMSNKAYEMGTEFIKNVVKFFTELPGRIQTFLTNAINNTITWATQMPAKAHEMGTNFINTVVTFFQELPGKVKEWFDNTVAKAKEWVENMKTEGGNAIKETISAFIEGAKDIPKKMAEVGKSIVEGVWQGILDAKDRFVRDVKDFFGGIVDGVKDALDINSPSKVMENEVGRWLPPGVTNGFLKALPSALNTMQTALTNGINDLSVDDVSVGGETLVTSFTDNLKNVYNDIALWFESVETRIGNSVKNMAESVGLLVDNGKGLVEIAGTGYVGYNGFTPPANRSNRPDSDMPSGNVGGGDTFNFYSPKPISEVEAARQMKKTKKDMAEGL